MLIISGILEMSEKYTEKKQTMIHSETRIYGQNESFKISIRIANLPISFYALLLESVNSKFSSYFFLPWSLFSYLGLNLFYLLRKSNYPYIFL